MKRSVSWAAAIVAGAVVVAAAQTARAQEIVTTSGQVALDVRKELATLPYYGGSNAPVGLATRVS